MIIVEHRRIILWTPNENAKIGIVRSSHDNLRPNVTYALVIVVIDVRMSWALRPLDNLGRQWLSDVGRVEPDIHILPPTNAIVYLLNNI